MKTLQAQLVLNTVQIQVVQIVQVNIGGNQDVFMSLSKRICYKRTLSKKGK